jgi:transcriptional regulator with XRE-family HTH domain
VSGEPPVRRRLVGGALRRYRENLGYTLDDIARVLECDRSKVSRIETGQRGIRPKELRELLAEYGVPAREQAALTAIASRGGQHGWWQPYRDALPGPYLDYVIMEAAADEIMTYEAQLVPELLQTDDYARALAAGAGYESGPQREEALAARTMRREAILRGRSHRLWVVLGEAALHQSVGGADVLAGQIGHLLRLMEVFPRLTLQVLPFSAGAHAAAGSGSLAILRFPDAPSLGVVYLEALSGGMYLEGQEDVARYIRAFARLRASALSTTESAQLLSGLRSRRPASRGDRRGAGAAGSPPRACR